ncbi:MAG: hypothetical protein HHJ12_06560, partial [Glaciimonas sp.]|nr:hypothetical protein [Glaciimonas sp.]
HVAVRYVSMERSQRGAAGGALEFQQDRLRNQFLQCKMGVQTQAGDFELVATEGWGGLGGLGASSTINGCYGIGINACIVDGADAFNRLHAFGHQYIGTVLGVEYGVQAHQAVGLGPAIEYGGERGA